MSELWDVYSIDRKKTGKPVWNLTGMKARKNDRRSKKNIDQGTAGGT